MKDFIYFYYEHEVLMDFIGKSLWYMFWSGVVLLALYLIGRIGYSTYTSVKYLYDKSEQRVKHWFHCKVEHIVGRMRVSVDKAIKDALQIDKEIASNDPRQTLVGTWMSDAKDYLIKIYQAGNLYLAIAEDYRISQNRKFTAPLRIPFDHKINPDIYYLDDSNYCTIAYNSVDDTILVADYYSIKLSRCSEFAYETVKRIVPTVKRDISEPITLRPEVPVSIDSIEAAFNSAKEDEADKT